MSHLETSPVAPPSIALARMAWKLAQMRIAPCATVMLDLPVSRSFADGGTPISLEYYHILRRIEDGEAP